ncbi:hypothetical protein J6T66_04625 [bacterium]|nr:hypothetical protein [bacterium]
MSDSRISEKILSEVCGHGVWNLNVGSIENCGEFAIKPHPAPLLLGEGITKSLLLLGGDLEEVKLESSENFGSIFEVFIVFRVWLLIRSFLCVSMSF